MIELGFESSCLDKGIVGRATQFINPMRPFMAKSKSVSNPNKTLAMTRSIVHRK
jgi:hypothetical protein